MNAEILILRSKLRSCGAVRIPLSGNCMQPLFCTGNIVTIVQADTLEVGDLCLINLPEEYLALHRLIEKMEPGYVFKGDRARRAELLDEKAIIGKASEVDINGLSIIIHSGGLAKLQAFLSYHSNLFTAEFYDVPKKHMIHNRSKSFTTEICYWLLVGMNTVISRKRTRRLD